jgi:hypothetical protein
MNWKKQVSFIQWWACCSHTPSKVEIDGKRSRASVRVVDRVDGSDERKTNWNGWEMTARRN